MEPLSCWLLCLLPAPDDGAGLPGLGVLALEGEAFPLPILLTPGTGILERGFMVWMNCLNHIISTQKKGSVEHSALSCQL